MRRLLAYLLTAFGLLCTSVTGQNRVVAGLEELTRLLQSSLVSFDYNYRTDDKVAVTGKGSITVQGKMYVMEGDGLRIWCDSVTRWTLDPEAREAYIETVSDSPDILSNPLPYINSLTGVKSDGNSISGTYSSQGKDIRFTITNIRSSERRSDFSFFRFDPASLKKDWVVTDLR